MPLDLRGRNNRHPHVHNTIKAAGNRVMAAAKTILAAVAPTDHTDDATDAQPEQ
jgi:hypothetical protein